MKKKILKKPTIKRLPTYLHILRQLSNEGEEYVSTTKLINELEFEPVLVRKDLATMDLPGKPRLGYKLQDLIQAIEEYLGWDETADAFLVGCGSLGVALMGYEPFKDYGLNIVAGFDNDSSKTGKSIHGKPVFNIAELPQMIKEKNIEVAILTIPWQYAQDVANDLIKAGIKAIWNFTTVKLKVPAGVVTHNENLASGLALFSVKKKLRKNINMDE